MKNIDISSITGRIKSQTVFMLTFLLLINLSWSATIYVPDNHTSIQGAIDAAMNGDIIIVRAGTYYENINFNGHSVTLTSESGSALTVLDGNQSGSVITIENGEDIGCVIEGFTICNGRGTYWPGWNDYYGGGIYCINNSSPMIRKNIITQNSVCGGVGRGKGGGVYCDSSSPQIIENVFTFNSAFAGGGVCSQYKGTLIQNNLFKLNTAKYGGGISCYGDDSKVNENIIFDNIGDYSGGGIDISGALSEFVLSDNIISRNTSVDGGGGICISCSSLGTVVNNVVTDNETIGYPEADGGGILITIYSSPLMVNNTIVNNRSSVGGGGLCSVRFSSPYLVNTIVWGNDAPTGPQIWVEYDKIWGPAKLTIGYSNVEGGLTDVVVDQGCFLQWGAGMIDSDPLFVDSTGGDYHILAGSACRDAGLAHTQLPMLDFEGDPRIANGKADIGADEYFVHLYSAGTPEPGKPIDLRVIGPPAAPVYMAIGSGIQDPPQATLYGDLFLDWPIRFALVGKIQSYGLLNYTATMPHFWNPGDEKPLQALVRPPGYSGSLLTNLAILEIE